MVSGPLPAAMCEPYPLPPSPQPLPPSSAHYLLVCVLNHLKRHLSRQTTSVVRNHMRSLWFDKEAHGDVRVLAFFRNCCCCVILLQLSPAPHAADNLDVLEKLLSNDAEYSPITIMGFEATCVCCLRLSFKFCFKLICGAKVRISFHFCGRVHHS